MSDRKRISSGSAVPMKITPAAAVIAPLGYVELIGTTILGYAIFGNFPDLWTWIGAAVIIASGLYIALRERRRRPGR